MGTATTRADVAAEYAQTLEAFLRGGGEPALHRAQDLGRLALTSGLGLLDLAAIHHAALVSLAERGFGASLSEDRLDRVGEFFAEFLAPFEMAHHGIQDAVGALRGLNEAMEAEARRVAHSLHDEANQSLAAALIALGTVREDLPHDVRQRLSVVKLMLQQAEHRLRHISHELRPTILDDLGLAPALDYLAEGTVDRTGLRVVVLGGLEGRLAPELETALYRSVQEAIANAVRHAGANQVVVRVDGYEETVQVVIEDDGVGFDVAAVLGRRKVCGMGIRGIQERLRAVGGRLEIESSPNQGTTLRLLAPGGFRNGLAHSAGG